MKPFWILTLIFFVSTSKSSAQWGVVDSSFGVNGVASIPGGCWDVAIQSDDKILVSGWDSGGDVFSVTRFNTDGSKDLNFGTNGTSNHFIGNGSAHSPSIALQSDGKIIQSGYCRSNFGNWCFALVRYTQDGDLDHTFSGDGIVLTSFNTIGYDDLNFGVAVQPDDKIIQVGTGYDNAEVQSCEIVRYNANGSLDNNFGNNGKIITTIGNPYPYATCVAVKANGKIAVGGYSTTLINAPTCFTLMQFESSGSPDVQFGNNGKVTTYFGGGGSSGNDYEQSTATNIGIQPDGKIILVGDSYLGTDLFGHIAIARYNIDGTLDITFGINGKVLIGNENFGYSTFGVFIQPDSKIITSGRGSLTNNTFVLSRFNVDGSPDTTFGNSGMVNTNIDNTFAVARSLDMQSDGKLIAAGYTDNDCKVVRYTSGIEVGINPIGTNNIQTELFPNPVHFNATIKYDLPQNDHLTMILKDMLGNTAQTFMAGENKNAGLHIENLEIDHSLSAGAYFLEIHGRNTFKLLKLIVQ